MSFGSRHIFLFEQLWLTLYRICSLFRSVIVHLSKAKANLKPVTILAAKQFVTEVRY